MAEITELQQWRHAVPSRGLLAYTGAFLATTVAAAFYLQPWVAGDLSVFPVGVDALWQQAIFQVHGLAGPVGVTDHLAYPIGMSGWALPQLGLLTGLFAWLAVGVAGMPAAAAVLWFQALCAGLNALAMLYALRTFPGGRRGLLAPVIAVSMGASVWTLSHQLNLALFAVVPLALGLLARCEGEGRRGPGISRWALLALVAVFSPLWWVVVLALLLPTVAVTPLLRRDWNLLRLTASVWAAIIVGLAVQTVLFAWRSGPGADASREPWQSNYFGGHLVDLVLGSPSIAEVLPRAERLREGATLEVSWGIAMVVLGAVSLLVLVRIPPLRMSGVATVAMASVTVTSTLYWLSGGLGNLQAGMGVLLGVTSPARVWYRMLLVLAVVGGMWVSAAASRFEFSRPAVRRLMLTAAVLLSAVWILDLVVAHRDYDPPKPTDGYSQMIQQVRQQLPAGCPVAQLPNETVPNQRVSTPSFSRDPLTYRSYLPFALAPEYRWSGGAYAPGQTAQDNPVTGVQVQATRQDFDTLLQKGYCAVLFDKGLSQAAKDHGVDIEGRMLDSSVGQPVWQDDTYALYVL